MSENVKITFKGSKFLNICEENSRTCYFYNIKPLKKKSPSINHHILLIDVSGSMYNDINTLKIKLNNTLDELIKLKNNYVSIIIYSGHNECYRIANGVKCDKTSYAMSDIRNIIDKELYTRGVTVISEPLEKAIDITKTLANVCNKHNIILFTDGCVVPLEWNCENEIKKCLDSILYCKDNNIFFNAVGFGKYYDRDFLKKLVNQSHDGIFFHIDEIDNFDTSINEIINKVNCTNLNMLEIKNSSYFIINSSKLVLNNESSIININNGITLVTFDEKLNIDSIDIKHRNIGVPDGIINDFLYSLSYYYMLADDLDNAQFSLAKTGDIQLYSLLSNCFSFVEKGNILSLLYEAINNQNARYKLGRETINITSLEDEPLCLLELLLEIQKDQKSSLLWDFKTPYKRIGMKKSTFEEDRYKFIYNKENYGRVTDLSIGSKKLNIGLKVEIIGEIQDKLSKLKLDGKIYKDYNLIVNGNINTKEISCILSRSLKMKFKKRGLLIKTIKHNGTSICKINLEQLKTTNRRLLKSMEPIEIANSIYKIEVLSCKQWALNKLINEILTESKLEKLDLEKMPTEELEARRTFRVSSTGIFTPIISKVEDNSPYEVYKATILEWKLEKFPEKLNKEKSLKDYKLLLTEDIKENLDYLNKELINVKREKSLLLLKVNLVRLSSGITGRPVFLWDNEIEKFKKQTDKVLNQNMVVDGVVTISTKSINEFSIRQDKYTLLSKCN